MRFTENAEINLELTYTTKTSSFNIDVDKKGASADNIFRQCTVLMMIANCANDGSNYFVPTYFESNDGSTYTACASTSVVSTIPVLINHATSYDDKLYACEYVGDCRYFRITFTATTSPSMPCTFVSILQDPERAAATLQV